MLDAAEQTNTKDEGELSRSKENWLKPGAGDLRTVVVEDVPTPGESVEVRGLPAAYSNEAQYAAMEVKVEGAEQVSRFNIGKMEILQFVHGCVDPSFSLDEAEQIARTFGPGFRKIITAIDELSLVDKKAIAEAEARFPDRGARSGRDGLAGGTDAGNDGPDSPVPDSENARQDDSGNDDRSARNVSA